MLFDMYKKLLTIIIAILSTSCSQYSHDIEKSLRQAGDRPRNDGNNICSGDLYELFVPAAQPHPRKRRTHFYLRKRKTSVVVKKIGVRKYQVMKNKQVITLHPRRGRKSRQGLSLGRNYKCHTHPAFRRNNQTRTGLQTCGLQNPESDTIFYRAMQTCGLHF
jgi:hypothetical protein